MPWSTPPTFVQNEILTASRLNQLTTCVEFLNGLGAGPVPGFSLHGVINHGHANKTWAIRHRHNYLHVIYNSEHGKLITITWNNTQVHNNSGPTSGWHDVVIPLSDYGTYAVGTIYAVNVDIEADDPGSMTVWYVCQTNSAASLI